MGRRLCPTWIRGSESPRSCLVKSGQCWLPAVLVLSAVMDQRCGHDTILNLQLVAFLLTCCTNVIDLRHFPSLIHGDPIQGECCGVLELSLKTGTELEVMPMGPGPGHCSPWCGLPRGAHPTTIGLRAGGLLLLATVKLCESWLYQRLPEPSMNKMMAYH